MVTDSLPSSSAWWVSIFQTKKKSQLSLQTKPQVSLCPQIHFSSSLSPLELWFDALETEPSACLGTVGLWWELERRFCGIATGIRAAFTSRIDSFAQESTPRSDITHCPSLSVLMEEAGELERGIFSTEVEFHTFSEMIFQFLLFFPPFFLLMVLGVSGLSQTWALNPGLSPEGQGLAWTLTLRIQQNKCEIT